MPPAPERVRPASLPQGADSVRAIASVTPFAGGVAVGVGGEIDLDSAEYLRQVLIRAMAACGDGDRIALDLSAVTFCDCSGLDVLLWARRRTRRKHRSMTITAASRQVIRLLELTGSTRLLSEGAT
ncbi:hypothetical protein GCM10020367_59250 [Streptomyces sannanensis]|uniref:Anti-sigma factor antagonist n=1 Tax=Streptomyces sannanensis TaxID=285536 RepID=A0ABP6SKI6_9ACTN